MPPLGLSARLVSLADFALWELAAFAAVVAAAGFLHGVVGFGFPILAMPVLSALFDAKRAVLLTVVPILVIVAVSAVRGGGLRASVGRYWWLPLCTAAGGLAGVRAFLIAPVEAVTLLLAALILLYLVLDRYAPGRSAFVERHWVAFGAAAGLAGGAMETTVNIGVPPLLIYFLLVRVEPLAMVQSINFVFLASKLVQAATLMHAGALPPRTAAALVPFAALATATLYAGMRVRDRLSVDTYRRALRVFLWLAAAGLLARVVWGAVGP